MNASYLSAGPCHHPRAPSHTGQLPGDIQPDGVERWLWRSPDYGLLCRMARYGASLHYDGGDWPQGTYANRVPACHAEEITSQIAAEVARGWLIPVTSGQNAVANAPLQVAVEPTKVRRITDYSNVVAGKKVGMNGRVDMQSLGDAPMKRSKDLARAVRSMWRAHGCAPLLLVRDVSKAFRRIGVCPHHAVSLRTRWAGQDYMDTRLPFGHAASAHLCCKLTTAVADAVAAQFPGHAEVLAYVDDFVLVANPKVVAEVEAVFNQVMHDVGLPLSESKASEAGGWSTEATWIGFHHDAVACTHALPDAKKDELQQLIRVARRQADSREPVKRGMWEKLVGKLSHVSSVFTVGRAFLTELYRVLNQPGAWLELSGLAVDDLTWWCRALDVLPRKAAMRKAPAWDDKAMITDASLSGQGLALFSSATAALASDITCLEDAAYGRVFPRGQPGDMTWLEAVAALSAVRRWGHLFEGRTGYMVVDNQPLEWAWKKGRSKSPRVNRVLREIVLLLIQRDAQIFPLRVQSQQNKIADALSRVFEPGGSPLPSPLARLSPQRLPTVHRQEGDPCPMWC